MTDALDPRTLITNIARDHADVIQLQFVRDDPDGIQILAIGAGFLNHIFRITSRDGKTSVAIKHGSAIAQGNPNATLPRTRIAYEYSMLRRFHQLRRGSAPEPYCFDENTYTVVMEYIGDMETLCDALTRGEIDETVAVMTMELIAEFHNASSQENMDAAEWAKLTAEFEGNEDMKEVKRVFSFDGVLMESYEWNVFDEHTRPIFDRLLSDQSLVACVKKCSSIFFNTNDCLIHGDLHHGSVLYKEGAVLMLDLEFGCLGPRSYDVANILTAYMTFYFSYYGMGKTDLMDNIKKTCRAMLASYMELMRCTVSHETFLSELTAISACYLLRGSYFRGIDQIVSMSAPAKCKAMEVCMRLLADHEKITTQEAYIEGFMSDSMGEP